MLVQSLAAAGLCCCSIVLAGSARAESGIASVYSYAGGQTASGRRSDPHALTAAHRTLPMGTKVEVVNERNGKRVTVTINDRGPFKRGRIIDVTPAVAAVLGIDGLARVTIVR